MNIIDVCAYYHTWFELLLSFLTTGSEVDKTVATVKNIGLCLLGPFAGRRPMLDWTLLITAVMHFLQVHYVYSNKRVSGHITVPCNKSNVHCTQCGSLHCWVGAG